MNKTCGSGGGGGTLDILDINNPGSGWDLNLVGKVCIIWRKAYGHDLDIIRIDKVRERTKAAAWKFVRYTMERRQSDLQHFTDTFPDIVALREAVKNKVGDTDLAFKKLMSYTCHLAIYDPKKDAIATLHYGVFDWLFDETTAYQYDKRAIEQEMVRRVKELEQAWQDF